MQQSGSAAALPGVGAGGEFAAGFVPPTETPPAAGTPAGTETPPATNAAATETPPAPPEWVGRIKDEGLRAKVITKGFRDEEALAKSYFEAETKLGVVPERIAVLPKDDNDAEGYEAIYAKLGKPEKADGYGIVPLEGQDPAWLGKMTGAMHAAGLSVKQAHALATQFNEAEAARQAAEVDGFIAKVEPELAALRQQWGDRATIAANEESIRRGMAARRGTPQQREAAEFYLGTRRFLEAMLEDGKRMREDSGPRGALAGGAPSVPQDRAGAVAEIDRLVNDGPFMAKYLNRDPEARAHMDALQKKAAEKPS